MTQADRDKIYAEGYAAAYREVGAECAGAALGGDSACATLVERLAWQKHHYQPHCEWYEVTSDGSVNLWSPECLTSKSGQTTDVDVAVIPTPITYCPYCGKPITWVDVAEWKERKND